MRREIALHLRESPSTEPTPMRLTGFTIAALVAVVPATTPRLFAQAQQETPVARLVAEPTRVNLRVGDSLAFKVTAYDASGNVLPNASVRVGGPRMAV